MPLSSVFDASAILGIERCIELVKPRILLNKVMAIYLLMSLLLLFSQVTVIVL